MSESLLPWKPYNQMLKINFCMFSTVFAENYYSTIYVNIVLSLNLCHSKAFKNSQTLTLRKVWKLRIFYSAKNW